MDARDDSLEEFQGRLGYRFESLDRLEKALTHRSYANESGLDDNYERLEFLGDAVLGLVIAEHFYRERPDAPEGTLTRLKSRAVREPELARYAAALGVGSVLRLGVGEDRSGGRDKSSLLADTLEAILGAVYLDGGLGAARRVIVDLLPEQVEGGAVPPDPKSRLQEWLQAQGQELPEYVVVEESGPDHDKRFVVECRTGGGLHGVGRAGSKKRAEQHAARAVLQALGAE